MHRHKSNMGLLWAGLTVMTLTGGLLHIAGMLQPKASSDGRGVSHEPRPSTSLGAARSPNQARASFPRRPMSARAASPIQVQPGNFDTASEDEAELDENESMNAYDNTPEQQVWRATHTQEYDDHEWTAQMAQEVKQRAASGLKGEVRLSDVDCRETVCRMYLQFADQLDAKAYIAAPHSQDVRYEYQPLDPHFDGKGFDASDHTFEVLVKRARPEGLPRHDKPRPQERDAIVTTNSGSAV